MSAITIVIRENEVLVAGSVTVKISEAFQLILYF